MGSQNIIIKIETNTSGSKRTISHRKYNKSHNNQSSYNRKSKRHLSYKNERYAPYKNERYAPYKNERYTPEIRRHKKQEDGLKNKLKKIIHEDDIEDLKNEIIKKDFNEFHEKKNEIILEIGEILKDYYVDIKLLKRKLKDICMYRYIELVESEKYVNQKKYNKDKKESHEYFLKKNIDLTRNLNNRYIKEVLKDLRIYKGNSNDEHFSRCSKETQKSTLDREMMEFNKR